MADLKNDEETSTGFKKLVLRDIAESWNPKIARHIPRFVYRKINKILHIDELNAFLSETHNDDTQVFLDKAVAFFDLKIRFNGFDKIEAQKGNGDLFIVANHPIGGPEGIALVDKVLPLMPDVKIMIQKLLAAVHPMRKISVYNGSRLITTLESVKKGDPVILFPAGFCSRRLKHRRLIYDLKWKSTFIKLSQRYGRTVLPIHISGRLSERMYRWYSFRRALHIKLQIETLFLVDEMFKCKGSELVFTVGNPIAPETFSCNADPDEWAARVRQYVFQLGSDPDAKFDPDLPDSLPSD
ncbi:MAG: hypothetical protein PHH94_05055 [Sphaerochaetaceae bacterium]|nr:hypothetical protein [Sphaerochaetaceae bacterium]MDD3163408.1 hypothetical protein [Sphaerochaetaceae bacterium]